MCGFTIGKICIKLTAYADDTSFLLKDKHSLNRAINIVKKFETFSSLKANIDKCEIGWIVHSKYEADKPVKFKLVSQVKDLVKVIGVYFSNDRNISKKKNFLNLVDDARTVTNIWRKQWLTLAGTIQVLNHQLSLKLFPLPL